MSEQNKKLNSIDTLVTREKLQQIMNEGSKPDGWQPIFIPSPDETGLKSRGLSIIQLNLSALKPLYREKELIQLAQVYAEVFAGPEWGEFTWCEAEQRYYDKSTTPGESCACGQGTLTEAYPLESTKSEIAESAAKPGALLMVLKNSDQQTVGFAWGCSYPNTRKFIQEKYNDPSTRSSVYKAIEASGIKPDEPFFYISECGILPDSDGQPSYRGLGITNIFFLEFIKKAKDLRLPVIMRTNTQSRMNNVAQSFAMEQIFGPRVVISDRRQLRVANGTVINGIDGETPNRVLYAIGGINL